MRKVLSNNKLLHKMSNTNSYHCRNNSLISLGVSSSHDKGIRSTQSGKVYSDVSRESVMINNLNHGINFKNEQNRVLCEINQNLSHIVSSPVSRQASADYGWKLYLDSITHLTEKTYSNFPLFGHGFDPPIRVHLIKNGKKLTFEFTICTLLKSLPFQSLLYSSVSSNLPSKQLLDECAKSVLEEMLLVTKEKENAIQLVSEYQDHSRSKNKALYPSKSSPKGRTFFERILIGITGCIYPRAFSNA